MRVCIASILFLILTSCEPNTRELVQSSWMRYYQENAELLFPYDITFKADSVFLSDGYLFTHKAKYELHSDSIILSLESGFDTTFYLKALNDSAIQLGKYAFYKVPEGMVNHFETFFLLGVQTANKLTEHSSEASFIALVKRDGELKVRLNDSYSEIENIAPFLIDGHRERIPHVYIYVGAHVELVDLALAYFFMDCAYSKKAFLITSNKGFNFFTIPDRVDLGPELTRDFNRITNRPPPPPPPTRAEVKEQVFIRSKSDFAFLEKLNTGTNYCLVVNVEMNIADYIELLNRIEKKPNLSTQLEKLEPKTHD